MLNCSHATSDMPSWVARCLFSWRLAAIKTLPRYRARGTSWCARSRSRLVTAEATHTVMAHIRQCNLLRAIGVLVRCGASVVAGKARSSDSSSGSYEHVLHARSQQVANDCHR